MSSSWTLQRKSKQKALKYIKLCQEEDSFREETIYAGSSSGSSKGSSLRESVNITGDIPDLVESDSDSSEVFVYDYDADDLSTHSSENVDMKKDDKGNGEKPETDKRNSSAEALCTWAITHNIHHTALKDLLHILRTRYDPSLPVDPRTLCRTPVGISHQVENICSGEYYHFGLKNVIQEFLKSAPEPIISSLQGTLLLKVNIDGLPLHKSSNKQLWPILVQFCTKTKSVSYPYAVGIFYGNSKPNNVHEYLKKFIEEVNQLKSGYSYHGVTYMVQVHCFICDAPARQFLKCITSHNGYSGCERCSQRGKYLGTMTFPKINAALRSNNDFKNESDIGHHKATSPLVNLDIGLVSTFVLDPMHLVYIGVMRKLLGLWLKGPKHVRIGTTHKNLISQKLLEISPFMPNEFGRKPRSLDDLERFKATEYRSFLMYTGPVCLLNIIHPNMYKNFLLLSTAVTLLSKENAQENSVKAKKILMAFVQHFSDLYGPRFVVYNIHSLIHLPDDVLRYGSLDRFSAFPFENHLGMMKRMLRKPNCALSQVINRIYERNMVAVVPKIGQYPVLKKPHFQGPVLGQPPDKQFKELYLEGFCIKIDAANQTVMVCDKVVKVENIIQYCDDSGIVILYREYQKYCDLYSYPVSSGTLGIFRVSNLSEALKSSSVHDIQCKYVLFPNNNDSVAFPLLHTDHCQ